MVHPMLGTCNRHRMLVSMIVVVPVQAKGSYKREQACVGACHAAAALLSTPASASAALTES
jgi:hypothetical protein